MTHGSQNRRKVIPKRAAFAFILLPCLLAILAGCDDGAETASSPVPVLEITPLTLDFGKEAQELDLTVRNAGHGTLRWTCSWDEDWIRVSPDEGETETSSVLTVQVRREHLQAGPYQATLRIRSNGGDKQVEVLMEAAPLLAVDQETLDFGIETERIVFHVLNSGVGTLEWTISPSVEWLEADPSHGETATEPSAVTVVLDREKMPSGQHTASLAISSNGGSLTVEVLAQEPEGASLYLGPRGRLTESPFPQDALWIRRIAGEPREWTFTVRHRSTLRHILLHVVLSCEQASNVDFQFLVTRGGSVLWSVSTQVSADRIYPEASRWSVPLDPLGLEPGDELVVRIRSEPDTWVYLGGVARKYSYLILG